MLRSFSMFTPMMDNGVGGQYYQQQGQHELQPLSMPSPTPLMWEQQYPSRVYPETSSNVPSSMKRDRVSNEESAVSPPSLTCDMATQHAILMTNCDESSSEVPICGTPKKARPNNYQAPRSVKPSLLTAMGTLAGGSGANKSGIQWPFASSVPRRRRLSGGHLDEFVGGHDMTLDTDQNRARSMSF